MRSTRRPVSGSAEPLIVVVCLNPALDVTYHVHALEPGASHRVGTRHERAGGKGLNVARVLHQLGEPTIVLGLLGGAGGSLIAAEISTAGIDARWTPIDDSTRRTVTVVGAEATVFLEPGPRCSTSEWAAFLANYREAVSTADVVVFSGSLPDGIPVDAYAQLIALAGGRPTILDTDGPALAPGLAARPYLAKPNAIEAAGLGDGGVESVLWAGAANAVVSDGAAGLTAAVENRRFHVRVPSVEGNPTGAGDALAAGLAAGVAAGVEWPDVLRSATALAVGAVAVPYAGAFDAAVARAACDQITVEEMA